MIPDPANYVMKGNKEKPIRSDSSAIDERTLGTLHDMTKEQLIELINRVSGAMWGIGVKNDEEIAEAMMLRLAIDALTTRDAKQALANINAWLDRQQGKPTQRIEQKVQHVPEKISDMNASELSLIISQLDNKGLLPAHVRLLPDGSLTISDAEYSDV